MIKRKRIRYYYDFRRNSHFWDFLTRIHDGCEWSEKNGKIYFHCYNCVRNYCFFRDEREKAQKSLLDSEWLWEREEI